MAAAKKRGKTSALRNAKAIIGFGLKSDWWSENTSHAKKLEPITRALKNFTPVI